MKVKISVKWSDENWADGTTHRTILVTPAKQTDDLFSRIATVLKRDMELNGAEFAADLIGDQLYLDLSQGEATITLHREHYLGESLWAGEGEGSQELLERIFECLHQAGSL